MIIHEEGEAGHDMPDLERPVQAVSKAVENLVKVRSMPTAHKTNGLQLRNLIRNCLIIKRRIFMWKPISRGEVTLLFFRVLVQVLGPSL